MTLKLASKDRVAIIGGGISGTFTAKYLSDYDVSHLHKPVNGKWRERCLLDEITVFDISPPPPGFSSDEDNQQPNLGSNIKDTIKSSSDPRPESWQGSRVSSITVKETVVELGASIIYDGNQLVVDMMNGDPDNLARAEPMMGTTKQEEEEEEEEEEEDEGSNVDINEPFGFGIYHGNKEWLFKTNRFSQYPSFLRKILTSITFLWRYNLDYFRLQKAIHRTVHSFDVVYSLLNDTQHELTYFDSPMDLFDAIGLRSASSISFHDLLDGIGLSRDASLEIQQQTTDDKNTAGWWDWRKWLPGMGCLRSELVTAMTLNTYNKDLNEMNGLVGLVAYVPGGEIFSIKGGNHKLMESALQQAKKTYDSSSICKSPKERIQHKQKQVTTVISDGEKMELLSGEDSLGHFDVVILAAPLQMCRIQFLTHNPMGMDTSILHPMPLGGVNDNFDNEDAVGESKRRTNQHGDLAFPSKLPASATTPYTSVVTTIISNATINATHFGLEDNETLPQTVLVSERGKELEGITTLRILSLNDGLVKIFSTEELSLEKRNMIFGKHHVIEYIQVWGGGNNIEHAKYGGATPNFSGGRNSESLPFLLYDGSSHWAKSDGSGPALYYVNAIESSVAAIEISAIGAKSVSKLVSRRLGLIGPVADTSHDEL
ncbi:hypothetical protein ACHAWC_011672 [Mediolabrus comicus]